MVAPQLGYEQLALREKNDYLIQIWFDNGLTWCHSLPTLSEAIEFIDGCENAALFAVEEPIEGLAVRRKLAEVLFGEWYPEPKQEELTMAKVKEARAGKKRDVVADLLGEDKPRKAKKVVKAKAGKNGKVKAVTGRPSPFEDTQTIKVLKKHPGGRDGSNVTLSLKVLQSGMTIGAWQKARRKAGVENPGFGVLRSLVNDGYVRVR